MRDMTNPHVKAHAMPCVPFYWTHRCVLLKPVCPSDIPPHPCVPHSLRTGTSDYIKSVLSKLLAMLRRVETFYDSIGGVLGYQSKSLQLIVAGMEELREEQAARQEVWTGGVDRGCGACAGRAEVCIAQGAKTTKCALTSLDPSFLRKQQHLWLCINILIHPSSLHPFPCHPLLALSVPITVTGQGRLP